VSIIIKSPREIALIREAGDILRETLKILKAHTRPGISTDELGKLAGRYIRSRGAIPSCKGYGGFQGDICVSVNEVLVHGVPSKKVILKEGDIVSYDILVTYKGYTADACRTYGVGEIAPNAQKLIDVTRECFFEAVKLVKPGTHLGDIGERIQTIAESNGYTVTEEFAGHGVGREVHEDPYVFNVGKAGTGAVLKKGMVIAIEPMINEGKVELVTLDDGWTTRSKDGKLTCHYENTVAVTESGYDILTLREGDE